MRLTSGENMFNQHPEWELSDSGIWKDKSNNFYRIGKDKQVFTSANLKDWRPLPEATWKDINSRFIKLINKKLFSSTDLENWTPLKDESWQSPSGVLYKFDKELNLYTKGSTRLYGLIEKQN